LLGKRCTASCEPKGFAVGHAVDCVNVLCVFVTSIVSKMATKSPVLRRFLAYVQMLQRWYSYAQVKVWEVLTALLEASSSRLYAYSCILLVGAEFFNLFAGVLAMVEVVAV
jgi:hypothetical protein